MQNQKIRLPELGLYGLFLKRLNEIETQFEVIPFPDVFEKLCRNFSIKKQECFSILFFLKDMGVIDVIYGKGVRIRKFKEVHLEEQIRCPE